MKNTKRRFVLFSFYDRTGIEAYLEKQAECGWMLDKISALGWHFHRIEPKKIHFSVVYFSKASAFDPEPSEQQLAFQDFCEHTGWKHAAANAQMQVFFNETPESTPIETDAALEVAAIHASAKKSHLSSYYLLTGVGILQMGLFVWRYLSDPISILTSNSNLFSGMCWIFMLALSLVEIVGYHRWHKRAKAAAELDGSFVETKGHQNFQLIILCITLLAFALLLISYGGSGMTALVLVTAAAFFCITAIVVGISELMKKCKIPARLNRNVTIILTVVLSFGLTGLLLISVVNRVSSLFPDEEATNTYVFNGRTYAIHHDELPLTIEDLIDTDYNEYSYELRISSRSFLAERREFAQRPRLDALVQPDLEYSVTTVKAPLLYDFCKKALLADFAHNYGHPVPEGPMWKEETAIDAAPWGAGEAYQLILGGEPQMRFLICYDSRIVEIDFEHDWALTDEQMRIIAQKLGG
ncbi:MAG: DUF2812 domain-containing protein [Eubacteriales bacterium]|nr:DUF2812 domain-containing protein [Eubacteriales bacterium]